MVCEKTQHALSSTVSATTDRQACEMANAIYPFVTFSFNGAQDVYLPIEGHQIDGAGSKGKRDFCFETTEHENIDYVGFDCSFNPENCFNNGDHLSRNQQSFSGPAIENMDMNPDQVFPLNQPYSGEKEMAHPISLASLELLKKCSAGNRLNRRKLGNGISPTVGMRELSTEEVIRVAGTRYIQISDHNEVDPLMFRYPFGSIFLSLAGEDSKDVELVHFLLATAEKIGTGLYDRAGKMLLQCEHLSYSIGNPVQRLVYYFADALRERVDRETCRISFKGSVEIDEDTMDLDCHPSVLALHQALPFAQIIQFTQIQIILDSVGSARKIHLIDLAIRTGVHWIVLMQALSIRSDPPLELLKITAVGMSPVKISETGKRLVAFAETLNLPFTFKMIVSDVEEIKEDMFGVDGSESLAVYAPTVLRNLINTPSRLEHLMKVIRNLGPLVMAVAEIEANHNSPSFLDRFIEALFFCGAYFDALDVCTDRQNKDRLFLESTLLANGIRNIVATEGSERLVRHVEIDVWRSFITRFGFKEMGLSHLSMYQAGLLVELNAFGSFCTLDKKGKALTIGWKGTPLHSISAWKCC